MSILKFVFLMSFSILLVGCDNPPTFQIMKGNASRADSCFMSTGIKYFKDGIPISGVNAEHIACVINLANNGDTEAQWILVHFYIRGTYVEPSPAKYAFWLRKLSDSGDLKAKELLAVAYYNGLGVQRNANKSVEILGELYEKGHINNPLMYSLALLTSNNPVQNWPIAKEILLKELENEELWAYQHLPFIYLTDFYYPQDITQAIHYFEEGINRGLNHFNTWLGLIYLSGNGVDPDYSKAESYFNQTNFVEAYKLIVEDVKSTRFSADKYDAYANDPMIALRRGMLFEAEGDYVKAFQAYKVAAKSNNYLAYKKIEEFINQKYVANTAVKQSRLQSEIERTREIFLNEIITTQSIIMFLQAFANNQDAIALELLEYYENDIRVRNYL
ncbi:tetratricopeptide repeat protein [Ignatzschineria sp. LJL83]